MHTKQQQLPVLSYATGREVNLAKGKLKTGSLQTGNANWALGQKQFASACLHRRIELPSVLATATCRLALPQHLHRFLSPASPNTLFPPLPAAQIVPTSIALAPCFCPWLWLPFQPLQKPLIINCYYLLSVYYPLSAIFHVYRLLFIKYLLPLTSYLLQLTSNL